MHIKLLNKMKDYVSKLDIAEYKKQNINNIFENYLYEYKERLIKKLDDEELINWYLTDSYNMFKDRLQKLLSFKQSPNEYLNFIKENKYKYNVSLLNNQEMGFYNMVTSPNFDFVKTSLTEANFNFLSFYHELYWLAVKFGFEEGKKHVYKENLAFKDDTIPETIKDAIRNVENSK